MQVLKSPRIGRKQDACFVDVKHHVSGFGSPEATPRLALAADASLVLHFSARIGDAGLTPHLLAASGALCLLLKLLRENASKLEIEDLTVQPTDPIDDHVAVTVSLRQRSPTLLRALQEAEVFQQLDVVHLELILDGARTTFAEASSSLAQNPLSLVWTQRLEPLFSSFIIRELASRWPFIFDSAFLDALEIDLPFQRSLARSLLAITDDGSSVEDDEVEELEANLMRLVLHGVRPKRLKLASAATAISDGEELLFDDESSQEMASPPVAEDTDIMDELF